MNKDEAVKDMAKILCPKGTANCEKCSKSYKCDVKFSQLAQLFDCGCRIIGDNEVVLKFDDLVKRDEKIKEFAKNRATKETTRKILQKLYDKFSSGKSYEYATEFVYEFAKENGIELE